MIFINVSTPWQDLEAQLPNAQSIVFQANGKPSLSTIVKEALNWRNRVNDIVYALIKAKVRHCINQEFQVQFADTEEKVLDDLVAQLITDCSASYSDLKIPAVAARIFAKVTRDTIRCVGLPDLLVPTSDVTVAQKMLNLMMGGQFHSDLISWYFLKGVLFSENKQLMQDFREAMQAASNQALAQLQNPNLSPSQEKLLEIFIANLLSLYPFTEPDAGIIVVPQKINGVWTPVNYQVENLPLNPDWLGGVIPALALKPPSHLDTEVPSLLLFRGTPHPSASGFFAAILADSIPGQTEGEFLYKKYSKDVIQRWFATVKGKVNLYGQSLGGCFSLLTLNDHLEKVSEVHIFGSPSFHDSAYESYAKRVEGRPLKPSVNIYWNNGDPIPLDGNGFHEEWNVYKLFLPEDQCFLAAHACINSVRPKVIVMKMDANIDSQSTERKVANIFHMVMAVLTLPFLILVIALRALGMVIYHSLKKDHGLKRDHNSSRIELYQEMV